MKEQGKYLTPFQRKLLEKSLPNELRPGYCRRIQIMLLADEGKSQTQICKTLSCSQETARYWISMAKMGQAHQWQERPIGRPKKVNEQYLSRLEELAKNSPRDYGYSFHRWTAQWLSKHLNKELGIEISDCHINYLLRKMGLSTRSKPAQEETSNQKDNDSSNIEIRDLTSSSVSELPKLRRFHSIHRDFNYGSYFINCIN